VSTDLADIPWEAVTVDGFARAEIRIPPFDRLDVAAINLSFYYTGDGPGLIQFFRDLNKPKPETWILHTDLTGELSAADDALWRITPINPWPKDVPA
jgi:hypothetical protein